jgi:hypothetical protein
MSQTNTPVGTTYPVYDIAKVPAGTQIAAGGGTIINTSALAAVFAAPVQAGQASPPQTSVIQPGGAINWQAGIACWVWTDDLADDFGGASVFVSPGLSQYEAGAPPWSGQVKIAGPVIPDDTWKVTGNGGVLTDVLLGVGAQNTIPAGGGLFLTDPSGFLIAVLYEGDTIDRFDTARGYYMNPGLIALQAGGWTPIGPCDLLVVYDQL